MSPPNPSTLLAKIDAVETLMMTNLPRIASIESWKNDCSRDMRSMQDSLRDRRRDSTAYSIRITRLEKHAGIQSPAAITALDAEAPAQGTSEPYLPAPAPAEPPNVTDDFLFTNEGTAQ